MLSRAPSRCKCGALARSAPPSARAGARQRATIACAASSAPLQEVDSELQVVDAATPSESFARCRFSAECEASLNEQIAVEYTVRPRAAQYVHSWSQSARRASQFVPKARCSPCRPSRSLCARSINDRPVRAIDCQCTCDMSHASARAGLGVPRSAPAHDGGMCTVNARPNLEHTPALAPTQQPSMQISYVYHSLYNYFDRDNVGLPGLAAFFKAASAEEREHAEMLMDYQTRRGGRVKLNVRSLPALANRTTCVVPPRQIWQHQDAHHCAPDVSLRSLLYRESVRGAAFSLLRRVSTRRCGAVQKLAAPMTEYGDDPKGAALYAMELALSLEKLNFQKLEELNACAVAQKDENLGHWVRTFLLQEQVKSVKEHAMYVAQLRRVGKGLGVYKFDAHIGASAA